MSNVEIRIIKDSSPNDIADVVRLYQEAGWWDDAYGTDFIEKIIKDSSCFAAVFENNQMIGMGRAISDGSSDAYIQDVTVLKAKRGRGIGKLIIRTLIDELKWKGIDWIGLIGEPGTQAFYEQLGFKPMENYIPMRLDESI